MIHRSTARRRPGVFRSQWILAAACQCLAITPALAQEVVEPVLRGQVLQDTRPLEGAQVVLHRVSPDDSGELDSIPSRRDGTFDFQLPRVPDPGDRSEVFFASVRHLGILYFGTPITDPVQLDSSYVIQVYDTVAAPATGADLVVLVRNIFIEQDEENLRVTDLFQVSNDGTRTWVPAAGQPTWTYPLPSGAQDFELGQGDMAPDQIDFEDGAVRLTAPVPPGERLLVFRYRLQELATTIPMPGSTGRAELLIREPAPSVRVTGLEQLAPVELERGSSYRRYLAEGIQSATAVVIPADAPAGFPVEWLALGMSLALVLVGIWAYKRPSVPGGEVVRADDSSERRRRILLEVARLDEERAMGSGLQDEEYRSRREALLARLSDVGLQ